VNPPPMQKKVWPDYWAHFHKKDMLTKADEFITIGQTTVLKARDVPPATRS